MAKATKADLLALASREISRGTTRVYDVVAETGQIFDNVKHMRWFRDAVAEEIARNSSKYGHLLNSDGDLSGLSGADCGCGSSRRDKNQCSLCGGLLKGETQLDVRGQELRFCETCRSWVTSAPEGLVYCHSKSKRKSSRRKSKKRSSRKSRK